MPAWRESGLCHSAENLMWGVRGDFFLFFSFQLAITFKEVWKWGSPMGDNGVLCSYTTNHLTLPGLSMVLSGKSVSFGERSST